MLHLFLSLRTRENNIHPLSTLYLSSFLVPKVAEKWFHWEMARIRKDVDDDDDGNKAYSRSIYPIELHSPIIIPLRVLIPPTQNWPNRTNPVLKVVCCPAQFGKRIDVSVLAGITRTWTMKWFSTTGFTWIHFSHCSGQNITRNRTKIELIFRFRK